VDGKQKRVYRSEWTKEDAEKELATLLLNVEPPEAKPASSMTLAQAAERYLVRKVRKRTLAEDRRMLEHLKSAFGAETPIDQLTAGRISEYRAQRLASTVGNGEAKRRLSAASVNRPGVAEAPAAHRPRRMGSDRRRTEDQAREGTAGPWARRRRVASSGIDT
jgi:hypothetical protein